MDTITIGVLKEPDHEHRVSLTPEVVAALRKSNIKTLIEPDAGARSFFDDEQYSTQGAELADREQILAGSDLVLSIHRPDAVTLAQVGRDKCWIGVYQPLFHAESMYQWNERGHTVFSMDTLPRTTRAQAMDVLSSQANIAGYKSVLLAATEYSRYFPMLMTAAGSVPPAKVLILGAGVAGLQAIATARRLGAIVEVFDTRPAVREEVMSLGARFVEVEGAADVSKAGGYAVEQDAEFQQRQKEKIAEHVSKSDIIITTAQIPGKQAPVLVTREMIESMRSGSVVVDLASATGGNTELTRDRESVIHRGVRIIGDSALYNKAASDASRLYAKNIHNFMKLLIDTEGKLMLNFNDDLVKGCCILHGGEVLYDRIRPSTDA